MRNAHGDGVVETPTIAHLGVGAFHRAHQAWYTHRVAASGQPWRIVAFTGRSPRQADVLRARGGRYTLLTRGADADEITEITSIREVHDGADALAWQAVVAHPSTRVVTLTITEAGYRLDGRGRLDAASPDVLADLRSARIDGVGSFATAPVRLATGLAARRASGAGELTVISCDNLSANGALTRTVVRDAAAELDPSLVDWIDAHVRFLSSMVDRITPRTTPADVDEVERRTGIRDEGTVVAEPFSEWIVEDASADGFAGARPAWEREGVRFETDLAGFEERKLRILNGAHSLLAYQGLRRGFDDVATAFADPAMRDLVEEYWEDAAASCRLPPTEVAAAVAATRERFANARIRHTLAQIAMDGAHKLPHRIVPVLAHAVASGGEASAAASAIAAWAVRSGQGADTVDRLLDGVADSDALPAMRAAIDRAIRRLESDPVGAVRGGRGM